MERPSCPGHSGKCRFCKADHGYQRYVGDFKQINRDGSPIVDECCRACDQNRRYAAKNFDPIASAQFGYKVPKGDEI